MFMKCRFCLTSAGTTDDFIRPCKCRGKYKLAHKLCLAQWFMDDEDGELGQKKQCEHCKANIILSNPDKLYNAFQKNPVESLRFYFIILRVLFLFSIYMRQPNKNLLEANLDHQSDIILLIICNLLEGFNYNLIAVFLIMKTKFFFNYLKNFKSFLLIGYGFSPYPHLPTLGSVFGSIQFMGMNFIAILPPISQLIHIVFPEYWGKLAKLILGSSIYISVITLVILMLEYHQYTTQLENCRFYTYIPVKKIYVLQEGHRVKLKINNRIHVISVDMYKILANKLNLGNII